MIKIVQLEKVPTVTQENYSDLLETYVYVSIVSILNWKYKKYFILNILFGNQFV